MLAGILADPTERNTTQQLNRRINRLRVVGARFCGQWGCCLGVVNVYPVNLEGFVFWLSFHRVFHAHQLPIICNCVVGKERIPVSGMIFRAHERWCEEVSGGPGDPPNRDSAHWGGVFGSQRQQALHLNSTQRMIEYLFKEKRKRKKNNRKERKREQKND